MFNRIVAVGGRLVSKALKELLKSLPLMKDIY